MRRLLLAAVLVVVSVWVAWAWLHDDAPRHPAPPSLDTLLDPAVAGFATVSADAPLDLPADHGAHPGARGELWSLFIQARDSHGVRYDAVVTITRLALGPDTPQRASAWAAREVYAGQLLLVRSSEPGLRSAQRLTRAALGLAGSRRQPLEVWVDDWSLTYESAADHPLALRLRAAGQGVEMALELAATKAVVPIRALALLGQDAQVPGAQAYLVPRLTVSGTLSVDGVSQEVVGDAWLDHAWGTLPGADGRLNLSRWAIHLDDDRELLCIRVGRRDGTGTPIPACALILADGRVQRFQRREILLEPIAEWTSPRSGARYVTRWRLAIPLLELDLRMTPLADEQEPTAGLPVWSGVVQVEGRERGVVVDGRGRLETMPRVTERPDA